MNLTGNGFFLLLRLVFCSMIMDPQPLTIVLLGNAGVGKSASGNTILGEQAFKSEKSFGSVTTEISEKSGQVFQKTVKVFDTPGILGLGKRSQIQTLCQELIEAGTPRLFLVVVKIDRFTDEARNAVRAAITAIGNDELKNSYILFTNGDSLDGKTLDDFINEQPDSPLRNLVERFAGKHLFNNENGGPEQVKQLLVKSSHLSLNAGPLKERRIILLGLPGDGKSASGNTIIGSDSDHFKSGGSFRTVTAETASKTAEVEGRNVKVVDTPGFTQTVLSPKKLYKEIVKAILEADPGPHAFVIVVRIGRISEAHIKLFEMLPKLFGKNSVNYTMILFTYGDELRGQSIEDMITQQKSLSKLVQMCGQRYCVFNNSQKANRQQVRALLDVVDEMVRANPEKHFTAKMFYDVQGMRVTLHLKLEEIIEWFENMLKQLESYQRMPNEISAVI